MKVLFKNTTEYTKKNCNRFIEFHNKKYGLKELIRTILISVGIIYILIYNIIYKNWLLVLGAIFIGGIIYLINKNKEKKKAKSRNQVRKFTFYFYKRYMKIKYKRNFERLNYFKFHKIFETDEYFFLYTDDKSALILSKEGFEVGTSEDFSKFIKNKCPFRYKNKSK